MTNQSILVGTTTEHSEEQADGERLFKVKLEKEVIQTLEDIRVYLCDLIAEQELTNQYLEILTDIDLREP